MAINDDRGGQDDFKSLLVSTATLGPVAIGLGLGIKNGLSQISSNRAIGNVLTGGRPNDLEMIGREVGKTRKGMVRDSLAAARSPSMRHGIKTSTDLFTAAAKGTGPQRNALASAYGAMLNSPYLNLNDTQIADEKAALFARVNAPDFDKDIMERIEKRKIELGDEKASQFIDQMRKIYIRSEEFESSLPTGSNLQFLTNKPLNNLAEAHPQDIMSGRFGIETRQRFTQLQEILKGAGLDGKFNIKQVTAGGGTGIFAEVMVGKARFDMPLSLIRNVHMKDAHGGIAVLGQGGRFSTQTVIGSSLDVAKGSIMKAEEHLLSRLKSHLGSVRSNMSTLQLQTIFDDFKRSTFDTGQFINPHATESELASAYMRSYLHEAPTSEMERITGDARFKGIVKPFGVTPGGLAGESGVSYLYDENAPIAKNWAGYQSREDLNITSRIQQWHRKHTIVSSNQPINFVSSLGWTDTSQVGMRKGPGMSQADLAFRESMKGAQTTVAAVFQFEEDIGGRKSYAFREKYGLYEGTGVAGRIRSTLTDTKTMRVMPGTRGGGQSPLLAALLERYNKGGAFTMKASEIRDIMKASGVKGTMLGYDVSGKDVNLGFSPKRYSGMEIRGIEEVFSKGKPTGEIKLSVAFMNRRGRYMKGHGPMTKGMFINAPSILEDVQATLGPTAKGIIGHLGSINPKMKNIGEAFIVNEAKQLLRSQMSVNLQMMTGTSMMLERYGKGAGEISPLLQKMDKMTGAPLANLITKQLQAAGASPEDIASVVASQFRINEKSLGEITSSDILQQAIRSAKGVIGLETLGLAPVGQGVGKPAKLERRSLHAITRHMKTLGASQGEIVNMLSDLTSRAVGGAEWEAGLTNVSLESSMKSMTGKGVGPLASYAAENDLTTNVISKKASEFGTTLRGNKAYTEATGINLTFDSPRAAEAAKAVFGSESAFIPGIKGMPALNTLFLKKGGQKVEFATEYERSLQNMLRTVGDPNRSVEQISETMRTFKSSVAKGFETSTEGLMLGKLAGSAQASLQSVNRLEFGPGRYKRMQQLAKADRLQSFFVSDLVFFKAVQGLKEQAKAGTEDYKALVSQTQAFLFDKTKGKGVYGMVTRHPTLGEGHVRFQRVRRAGTIQEAEEILKVSGVRRFFKEKLNVRNAQASDLHNFLSGKLGTQHQKQFASLMLKQAASFSGSSGTAYLPQLDGVINIIEDGKSVQVPHKFSSFMQMVGDTDGDTVNLILANGKTNRRWAEQTFKEGKSAKSYMVGEAEWMAMQRRIKSVKDASAISEEGLSSDYRLQQQVIAEMRGKNVGAYSIAMDKLKVGIMAYGKDDRYTRQGVAALSILEELLIKASKKQTGAGNVAERFATAINMNQLGIARGIIEEHAFGKGWKTQVGASVAGMDVPGFMGQQTSDIDMDAMLNHMFESFEELRASGGVHAGSIKRVRNALNRAPFDMSTERLVSDLESGSHSLVAGAANVMRGGGMQSASATTIDLAQSASGSMRNILKSKGFMVPAAVGAVAGLAALSLSGPGYSPKPLMTPDESLSSAARDAISSGSVLSGLTNALDGSSLQPEYNPYPSQSRGSIIENTAYVEDSGFGARVDATIDGLSNISQAKSIIGAMGLGSNHLYIQDNRRPISKSLIDSLSED